MKSCGNINEKLPFFDDLNEGDKGHLLHHLDECESCREKFHDFQNIMSAIKSDQEEHPIKENLLMRYSVYLAAPDETDYNGKSLSRSKIGVIEKHTSECGVCQAKVERFKREYQEIENYLDETDLPELALGVQLTVPILLGKLRQWSSSLIQGIKNLVDIPIPRFYPVAAGAVATLVFMIWVGPFFRGNENAFLHLASVDGEQASFLTRSNLSQLLAEGLVAFNEGEYDHAIQRLEKFTTNYPDDPSLFYAHFVLGITYLNQAKNDFLGRFQRVNIALVDQGIENLETAKGLIQNSSITESCNWYKAMAFLMKDDEVQAKNIFESIVDLRGRRFKRAKEMIAQIDRLMHNLK